MPKVAKKSEIRRKYNVVCVGGKIKFSKIDFLIINCIEWVIASIP